MLRKGFVFAMFAAFLGFATIAAAAVSPTDLAVQNALRAELAKKHASVQAAVEDRVATLDGTVDSYLGKRAAERTARKYPALTSVVNRITVAGPSVADEELAAKLARKLAYDRPSQGNVFNAFIVSVQNGAVTVSGYARDYMGRNSAIAVVAAEKGVKDVVDRIEVLPTSTFDDRIRLAAIRRIYANPSLQKYAVNPAHPIRVIVRNGHVILEGAVLNEGDRTIAGLAANSAFGAFSVTNNLKVDNAAKSMGD